MLHFFHRGGLFYPPHKQNHKTYKPGIIATTDINLVSFTSQYRYAADCRNLSYEHVTKSNNDKSMFRTISFHDKQGQDKQSRKQTLQHSEYNAMRSGRTFTQ